MSKGTLAVISGFSGVGKGTVVSRLVKEYPYSLSVSATTRDPRPGEIPDQSYHFISKDRFEELIRDGGLIEWTNYVGNYYGTPRKFIEDEIRQGHDVILEIESDGAFQVRRLYPDAILIYMLPPTFAEVRSRLVGRGTESADKIRSRLAKARDIELDRARQYDFLIVNDDVDTCAKELDKIIRTKSGIRPSQTDLLDKLKKEADSMQL
jgi:guanylate kinase